MSQRVDGFQDIRGSLFHVSDESSSFLTQAVFVVRVVDQEVLHHLPKVVEEDLFWEDLTHVVCLYQCVQINLKFLSALTPL